MARPLRIVYEGAWYHIMNRGQAGRRIFLSDRHRLQFLSLLKDITELWGVEIHAYCLMQNHYHLLVRTPEPNLSRAMRHLNGVYTQQFNKDRRTDGSLFRGRYKAVLVQADTHLAQLSRYIHLNPVEAGLARKPEHYPWSSYRAYLGRGKPPPWLRMKDTLARFGPGRLLSRFAAFVESGVDEETRAFFEGKGTSAVMGSREFRDESAGRVRSQDRSSPQAKRLRERPGIAEIKRAVADAYGVDVVTLDRPARGPSGHPARSMAIALCRNPGGHPLSQIAESFGMGNSTSAGVICHRLWARARKDPSLKRRLEGLAKALSGP